MRDLDQVPNIGGVSVDYPDGNIVDEASGVTGTALTEILYGDTIQAIHKLKRLAGITANDNPDNESNGFQVLTAMIRQGLPQWYAPSSNVDFSDVKFVQYNNGIYYHKTSVNTNNDPSADETNWFRVMFWNGTRMVFSNEQDIIDQFPDVPEIEDTGWLEVTASSNNFDTSDIRVRQRNGVVFVVGEALITRSTNVTDIFEFPDQIGAPTIEIDTLAHSAPSSITADREFMFAFQVANSTTVRGSFREQASYRFNYSYPVG